MLYMSCIIFVLVSPCVLSCVHASTLAILPFVHSVSLSFLPVFSSFSFFSFISCFHSFQTLYVLRVSIVCKLLTLSVFHSFSLPVALGLHFRRNFMTRPVPFRPSRKVSSEIHRWWSYRSHCIVLLQSAGIRRHPQASQNLVFL